MNADAPIVVTDAGMDKLSALQPLNAYAGIAVVPAGIEISVMGVSRLRS